MKISSLKKVLDKIRKLKRHETSARKLGSVEEANAFAHRVTVLLEKYRLEEADIDFSDVAGQPAISQQEVDWGDYGLSPTRRRCSWLEGLAIAVGMNNGTVILSLQGTNMLTLVGKPAQRAATEFIVGNLIRFMKIEVEEDFRRTKKYVAHGAVGKSYLQGYRKAWRKGFVQGVAYQYQQRQVINAPSHSRALTLLNNDFQEAFDSTTHSPAKQFHNALSVNELALVNGFDQAQEANLDANGLKAGECLYEIQA